MSQDIDLDDITDKDELEQILMKINIHQIGQSIVESQATVRKMQADSERANQESQIMMQKLMVETAKLQREKFWYPLLPLLLAFMTGGGLVALITFLTQPTPIKP